MKYFTTSGPFCVFFFFNNSTFSCSSAASVFSLREVQLQKDPGHRSSVFQPLGKTLSFLDFKKNSADYKTHLLFSANICQNFIH